MAVSDALTFGAIAASALGLPDVEGAHLLIALGIFWLFAKVVLVGFSVKEKIFPTPNPPISEKFRQVKDCEKLCSENILFHEKIDREINERFSAMSSHSAQSREKLYVRVANLESKLSALEKENEMQTQHLYSLEQKMDRLLEHMK